HTADRTGVVNRHLLLPAVVEVHDGAGRAGIDEDVDRATGELAHELQVAYPILAEVMTPEAAGREKRTQSSGLVHTPPRRQLSLFMRASGATRATRRHRSASRVER